jgi:hypothetical protein
MQVAAVERATVAQVLQVLAALAAVEVRTQPQPLQRVARMEKAAAVGHRGVELQALVALAL